MKKYAIILLALIIIGLALTVRLFTQEQRLDPTVFLETTKSIRNLQALDKNLLLLLNQSRYSRDFEHQSLSDTNIQISEEFDNLRYEALFEEIEASPGLSAAVQEFEDKFALREETLEAYIDGNSNISGALLDLDRTGDLLSRASVGEAQQALKTTLANSNAEVYRLALGGEFEGDNDLLTSIERLGYELEDANKNVVANLSSYKTALTTITENHQATKQQFSSLSELQTGPLLDAIEDQYTNYHNQAIAVSNQFRNWLMIYGLALLGALLFFAFKIRTNYLSLEQQITERTREIETAYTDLKESQEQLIQSEKMASLGQMVAGVAHEINTPLGYVTSNIDTLKLNVNDLNSVIAELGELSKVTRAKERDNKAVTQRLVSTLKAFKDVDAPELAGETQQLLDDGAYGLSEISKLVTSLKDFARLDRQSTEQVNIHDCINSSLTIASNHIKENSVLVKTKFNELPKIDCFPSKLNQLFLNIITNACQAMATTGGKLSVRTKQVGENIVIRFIDQGIGMDEDTQQKMFDPFFTSKEIGKGTGLGMSIAYKIVQAHQGSIAVKSKLGEGTEIKITLPVNQTGADDSALEAEKSSTPEEESAQPNK